MRVAFVFAMIAFAGLAALSWELLWQLKSSLSIGVSARGAAITLIATMGGMTLGSLAMGRVLKNREVARPLRLYGLLEVIIGLSGVALGPAFVQLEAADRWVYQTSPGAAPTVHLLGIVAILGAPTMAMGATIPVFGLIARRWRTSLSKLYAINTAGAALGVLAITFALLPELGVHLVAQLVATVNLVIAAVAFLAPQGPLSSAVAPEEVPKDEQPEAPAPESWADGWRAFVVVFVTGFATFALEVSWFRSLRAALNSTTESFALMLVAVLVPLAVGASAVARVRRRGRSLGAILALAGVAVLLATPVMERFDLFLSVQAPSYLTIAAIAMAGSLVVIGLPVLLLGMPLPWILDDQDKPRRWGLIYATNTLGAVAGSLVAAWGLLPAVGFAAASWVVGLLLAATGIWLLARNKRGPMVAAAGVALLIAYFGESGVGSLRAQGNFSNAKGQGHRIVAYEEGPDSTYSVVDDDSGARILIIDGFSASRNLPGADAKKGSSYMAWMGHLPMLLHPDPQNALVICFGTGTTTDAVRQENPKGLDVVDISAEVFSFAGLFDSNNGVLEDPRVHHVVMDGRAWLRRTDQVYDAITLEPMPPNFAGVNALYSREFYELAAQRMSDGGIIAQWLPFHLVSIHDSAAIAATFRDVFPDSVLWMDGPTGTGILLGRKGEHALALGTLWPGFGRTDIKRRLSESQVRAGVVLDGVGLKEYASVGEVVSDDNQLLAYGGKRHRTRSEGAVLGALNRELVTKVAELVRTGALEPRP